MADERTAKNPLGPTGETVRENVERLRTARRLTYKELAERLERNGRPIPVLGLSRIEKGARRVDADDLVALAHALGVNPSALLFPPADDEDESVAVSGAGRHPAAVVWDWADGKMPLVDVAWDEGQVFDFHRYGRPPGRRQRFAGRADGER